MDIGHPVGKVRMIDVACHGDPRGNLFAFEEASPLPFRPVRVFIIADVPAGAHRARHELSCDQFLWMLDGSCRALVKVDGQELPMALAARGPGLYLPKGVWLDLHDFAPDSALVCLAAAAYQAPSPR